MNYRLYRGARLRFDHARQQQVLLRAEEVTELNETAYEILQLCDGRSEEAICSELASRYPQADAAELRADIHEFLDEAFASQWVQREDV